MKWLAGWMRSAALDALAADVRYAWRGMRRSPSFFTVAVLTLALGIGINAAIFSVFAHVLLAPLRFPDAGNLYVVTSHAASLGDARRLASGPDFRDFRDAGTTLSGVAAAIGSFTEPWTGDGTPRVVQCTGPTQQFFSVMGIRPLLGRLYTAQEYAVLDSPSVLISEKFWKRELGGDPHVIGRRITIGGAGQTIVGVVPTVPDLYPDTDLWLTTTTEPAWPFMNWRANKFLEVFARLKPGVRRSVAEQQLTTILRRGEGEPQDVQVRLTPLKDYIVGPVRKQLSIILAAVALVLLVTCMNTAALLLSRAVKRAPEMAIRMGLGATRARIGRQLLAEGLLLSAIGGTLGLALASISLSLVQHVPGLSLPRLDGLHLNGAAVSASIALVALASGLVAILPASVLSGLDLTAGLRGGRTETGRAQRRPFAALIVAEVACAVVLTVCAGLLVRSFLRVQEVDLGFQPGKVLTAYLRTPYFGPEGHAFWSRVLHGVASLPQARWAAVSDCMPGAYANSAALRFDDRPDDRAHAPSAEGCWISADYFRALGGSLLRGRYFSEHDDEHGPPVVIINAEAARRFYPGQDPVGKHITVDYLALGSRNNRPPPPREIVGVVGNVRQRALDLPSEPAIYMPYTQDDTNHVLASMNLFVRSGGGAPELLANSVRGKIQSLYPNQPVERITVMREVVAHTLARRTYSVGLMTAFAVLALLLCALGIYGVVSWVTLERTREIGIRMALGASRKDVLLQVLHQGTSLVAAGVGVGIGLSLLVTRALSQLLFETTPLDPAIFLAAALLLGATGVLACLLPGIRAAQMDPRAALNTE
ncbi:MAG TPA: ABC transporter permease [Acidobacteriaceae bacterium]|nr:ABC transporter permease [Acidobacteriaceae bacterium]